MGASRDSRYSGARRGIGGIRKYWGAARGAGAIMGASWGIRGVLGLAETVGTQGPDGV